MKIYVTVGGTQNEKTEFAELIVKSEWHGEWNAWTQSFIFEEDNNPEAVIEELELIAEENNLRINCLIEYDEE